MRKVLVLLAVASLLICAVSAQAVTTTDITLQLYGETNWFCSPIIPFNPHLLTPAYDIDPNGCFVEWMSDPGLLGSDALNWFDSVAQSSDFFPFSWVDHAILMGDGYTAWVTGAQGNVERELHYSGVDISDTDAWISLPGMPDDSGGWHLVGIPYPVGTSVWWGDVIATDGVDAFTLLDLIWVNSDYRWGTFTFSGLDASSQNSLIVPDFGEYLDGGRSYWLYCNKSNLALILPSPL